jgi:hypothetical protein
MRAAPGARPAAWRWPIAPTSADSETPVQVTLDGATHTARVPLEILSATDRPGERFTLQIAASTVAYQTQRATGAIDFSRIHLVLPTVDPARSGAHYGTPNPAAS